MEENAVKTAENKQTIGKPFVKGDPRINTNGRPKGTKNFATLFENAIKKIAETQNLDESEIEVDLVLKAIAEAKKGKYQYHKDIFDRVYGQADENINQNAKVEIHFDTAFNDSPQQTKRNS